MPGILGVYVRQDRPVADPPAMPGLDASMATMDGRVTGGSGDALDHPYAGPGGGSDPKRHLWRIGRAFGLKPHHTETFKLATGSVLCGEGAGCGGALLSWCRPGHISSRCARCTRVKPGATPTMMCATASRRCARPWTWSPANWPAAVPRGYAACPSCPLHCSLAA